MKLETSQVLLHYQILGRVGAGGMGEVYRALDTRLQREVALKSLPDELARNPEAKARFLSEARAASALGTPPEHKRYFVYPGAHTLPRTELATQMLGWLDRYLGPVVQ